MTAFDKFEDIYIVFVVYICFISLIILYYLYYMRDHLKLVVLPKVIFSQTNDFYSRNCLMIYKMLTCA